MRRVVSLFLPTWSTDRVRRKAGKPPDGDHRPLITALPDHGHRIVAAADADARRLGVLPGMTVTRARSLAPELLVVDAEPEDDLAGLRRLALWAGRRYSPFVAPDPPDGIWIDISGCAHRFDGETPLLRDILRRVSASGLGVQVAVADTPGCAHAVARHVPSGRPNIVEPGRTRAALAILPISALRIEPGVADELRRMGFERVEQLVAQPRAPLAKRFGKQLYRRLDQAVGLVAEPIEPIFPAHVPRVRRGLLEPISTAEAFAQVIRDLVGDLVVDLVRTAQGARRLDLYFDRVDSHCQAIRVGTATPSRDAGHLAKLLCQKIETVDPGLGVEAMTLVAPLIQPLDATGIGTMLGDARRGPDLAALVDALANRFGQRQLYRSAPLESSMPEREIGRISPLARPVEAGWGDDLPRPARMIVPPEPVEVTAMLPDHPPAMFIWRGKRFRVAQADGPERLHGEWWREAGHEAALPYAVRDYFQVETTTGGRYWLFRLGDGESPATGPMKWFVPRRVRVSVGHGVLSDDPLLHARYVELQITTHFSFLRGASSPEELFEAAANLGLPALGVVDRNTLGGLVRAWDGQKVTGVRSIAGCRLDLVCGTSLLVYPTDAAAYARLCRLLTIGKGRAGKGSCHLHWSDVEEWSDGLIAILVPDRADAATQAGLARIAKVFGSRGHCALTIRRRPRDAIRLRDIARFAAAAGVVTVATGDVLYHSPERRLLQDVVSCIREKCTVDTLGQRRERFADRHLRSTAEMERLFGRYLGDPAPVHRSVEIARACRFDLADLTYTYPDEVGPSGLTSQAELERLTWIKAPNRYPKALPDKVRDQLVHELRLIDQMKYASYFLTVHAIVAFARSKNILCQGRGSAANSAVCFVLGITSIDPVKSELLFERFVSAERREPPDIDVDFEHERREEVIQWIYETYGRERSALTAVVSRFRARGAVREVGKALGLSEDVYGGLASQVWGWAREGVETRHAEELNLDTADRRLALTLELARVLINTPRHTSQHPGGFVLTLGRLDELVPIEPAAMKDRQIIEWDKDDIDALGFMKVDVLGLGMLGCMRRAFTFLEQDKGVSMDLATIPHEDPATYAMIRKADTLGVFQIESRAQMNMLPRIKPKEFYDLVVQVAIVRPGPIQGNMVHPYLRRREGSEPITYPTKELERVLGKTLGVPLFQEQAMRVAIECAGFTASEADLLRRAMATFKLTGGVSHFRDKLIDGMIGRGYERAFAEQTFTQIEGFGSYGFPESHAASFALIAYASSWMKCHHPDAFCAALLNAQPMGFYAVAQIVGDARKHGVEVRPIDVNHSRWDCTLEATNGRYHAVRLGLRYVRDLKNADGAAIALARCDEPYASVEEIQRRANVSGRVLDRIGHADGFGSLGNTRRSGLWDVKGLGAEALPLFACADQRAGKLRPEAIEPAVALVPMGEGEEVVEDYRSVGLSLRAHPLAFLRDDLGARKMITCAALRDTKDGRWVNIAGLVLLRQKPGSAKGVMFITLEDETDIANLVVWPSLFERHRRVMLGASMMGVRGQVQREGEVIHVVAQQLDDLSSLLASVGKRADLAHVYQVARGDVVKHGMGPDPRDPAERPLGRSPRDIYIPDLRLGSGIIPGQATEGIKIKPRDFR